MQGITYDEEKDTLTFRKRNYHCVAIKRAKNSEGKIVDWPVGKFIGGEEIKLNLSPTNPSRAILRGINGETTVGVKGNPSFCVGWEEDGIILFGKTGKKNIWEQIEYLTEKNSEGHAPSNALKAENFMIALKSVCFQIAEEYGLITKGYSFLDELGELKNREGFSYEKDFSYLYPDTIISPK